MGRRVIMSKDVPAKDVAAMTDKGPAQAQPKVDDYITKLLKYIPAEIVAAFLFIDGLIKSLSQPSAVVFWIVFIVLLILTPLYMWRVTTEPDKPAAVAQIIIATFGFFVWVFAIGGPFSTLGWYLPVYGSILLVVYTLVIPIVQK
jgi:hypothetical protein